MLYSNIVIISFDVLLQDHSGLLLSFVRSKTNSALRKVLCSRSPRTTGTEFLTRWKISHRLKW